MCSHTIRLDCEDVWTSGWSNHSTQSNPNPIFVRNENLVLLAQVLLFHQQMKEFNGETCAQRNFHLLDRTGFHLAVLTALDLSPHYYPGDDNVP